MLFIIFTMFFSGGMVPTFLVVQKLGLTNTIWAMIVPGMLSVYNMIVLRTSFESVPESLYESAALDGANHFTMLTKITLPLSKAALATITLFYAVGKWGEWYNALVYLQKRRDLYPLQMFLRELLVKQEKLGNELAKGMMQKASICCALAIHPKVVMLDEPMVGLDPAAIKELKEVVLELKEKGCTILISTHMLEMVKDLWDVMFVMEQGKIIATFNKKEIADKDIEELFFEVTEPKTGGEEHE